MRYLLDACYVPGTCSKHREGTSVTKTKIPLPMNLVDY